MQPAVTPAVDASTPHRSSRTSLCHADGSPVKIVVVDSERIVAEMISTALRCEGAEVIAAGDGAGAITAACNARPDVAIVDPRLPDMDEAGCLSALREQHPGIPLLLLKANPGEFDRIARATTGGDWLIKPFSLEEVLLRVRVMLRRHGVNLYRDEVELVVGDLVLNEESREVARGGRVIRLTHTEFELLRFFMRNENHVVTKQQILGRVWPYDFARRSSVVELYVSYLRKKIDAGHVPMIRTLRHAGYILTPAGAQDYRAYALAPPGG